MPARFGPAALKHPQEQEKLAGEAVQARQPDARQGNENHCRGQAGRPPGQPAEVGDFPRVITLVEHAHQGEHRAGGQPVIDHLQHAALHGQPIQREDAQHAEAENG